MNSTDKRPIILVVDDVPGNIKTIKAILCADYRLFAATNGQAALKTAATKPVDLILLDVVMPEQDGFEVCKALKQNPNTAHIPVIFVTARQEEVDEAHGFRLGAVDYITKPISPPILRARVRSQMEIQQLNRSLEKSNRFIRNTFCRYMSDELVEAILDTPEGLRLGGERKSVTVLMSDLRGFTAIGDRMAPEQVISMLNFYLEIMTEIILRHKGTIIEFLGDGILVVFGTPVTREDDAERAVVCALEMQLAMARVNENNRATGFPDLLMGCGISSGQVVAGNIGSELRSKYGVVGHAINLAARVESFSVGGDILVAENSVRQIRAKLRRDDHWISRIKGISDPITIYRIGGIEAPYDIQLPEHEKIDLHPLADGITVKLTPLEGKQVNHESYDGMITEMTLPVATIESGMKTRVLDNIQIALIDAEGNSITRQLYGKVVEADPARGRLQVHFTSFSPDAERFFKGIGTAQATS